MLQVVERLPDRVVPERPAARRDDVVIGIEHAIGTGGTDAYGFVEVALEPVRATPGIDFSVGCPAGRHLPADRARGPGAALGVDIAVAPVVLSNRSHRESE